MKRTKLHVFTVAALAGMMACGPLALAQDNSTPPPSPPAAPVPGDNGTPPPRPKRIGNQALQAMVEKLSLTPDQKDKVGEAMKVQRDKAIAARQDKTLSEEDKRAKMKEARQQFNETLKGILTSEQYTKFQEIQRNARPGGGAPPPPAAPATPAPPSGDKN